MLVEPRIGVLRIAPTAGKSLISLSRIDILAAQLWGHYWGSSLRAKSLQNCGEYESLATTAQSAGHLKEPQMSLEAQIVDWGTTRPVWQRSVLRRVALGQAFTEKDYDDLVDAIVSGGDVGNTHFGIEHLPQLEVDDPPVTLVSISDPKHVNALASDKPLTFGPNGLTIIYGDNGSGKSGYARILKRIARSRHQEEILSDVFRDTAQVEQQALITARIGETEQSFSWPKESRSTLARVHFYDEACGKQYTALESDFPYRPSVLGVMDGLIASCTAVRARIDSRLDANARAAKLLPLVDETVRETDVGKFLRRLSGKSSLESLDTLTDRLKPLVGTIEDLKTQEARLQSLDASDERRRLSRQAGKLDSLRSHLEVIQSAFGNEAIAAVEAERDRLAALEEAANSLTTAFGSEPLLGVGTSPWKELWESARRFSETYAYPAEIFPVIVDGAKCVLCQQDLQGEAKSRFSRFQRFVEDDTQTRLRDAYEKWNRRTQALTSTIIMSEVVESNLSDLEGDYGDLVHELRALLAEYEAARADVVNSFAGSGAIPRADLIHTQLNGKIEAACLSSRAAAEALLNPEALRIQLASVTARRKELELVREVLERREAIVHEIRRLNERETLEAAKSITETGSITKKMVQLSEDNVTEVVRDTFTRETDRLRLERVTIKKTRADKGLLLHQPKLVGARQEAKLPSVLSEGEKTALGLAAFFTEVNLDASKSAVILDDPVSSLDHIRRRYVAKRLSEFAETRQVIVFTHDASLFADLKREASGLGVTVTENAVVRGRRGEKKPGECSNKLPWKVKDVAMRLDELGADLSRIARSFEDLDEAAYEKEVGTWAGSLSETWERIFSQEVVGPILADGGIEVRPSMVKILAKFSAEDDRKFQASYNRISQWAKRHDKSTSTNFGAPDIRELRDELEGVKQWFERVRGYKN